MTLLISGIGLVLGAISAFIVFAMAFNGYSWGYQIAFSLLMALGSGLAVRIRKPWTPLVLPFFIPFLPLFILLVLGSAEKGGWLGNLGIIVMATISIWLPATFVSKHVQ
jgi:hypothetical protein